MIVIAAIFDAFSDLLFFICSWQEGVKRGDFKVSLTNLLLSIWLIPDSLRSWSCENVVFTMDF